MNRLNVHPEIGAFPLQMASAGQDICEPQWVVVSPMELFLLLDELDADETELFGDEN